MMRPEVYENRPSSFLKGAKKMNDILRELIKRNSRKPMYDLLKEGVHLSFDEDAYSRNYCENHCLNEYDCEGDCRDWEMSVEESRRKVYGADLLIGEVLREGYQVLGISGVNEPFKTANSRDYANMYWEDSYSPDSGICANCEFYGSGECPEDILSAKCPRSGNAWAVERITDAVNEVIAS